MDKIFYKTKITKCIDDYNYIIGIINEKKEDLERLKLEIDKREFEYFEHEGSEISITKFIKEEEKNISIIEKALDI